MRAFDTIPDITNLKEYVLEQDGSIKCLPAAEWRKFPWEKVRYFMHEYPIYVLPTEELIDVLDELIGDYKTIEIGAGAGQIGKHLDIKQTDSYLQARNDIKLYYLLNGQPVIKYPPYVIKADALTAYRRFKPECMLGCYVTHYSTEGAGSSWGVDFQRLLPLLKRLILVVNKEIHGENPIMKLPHREINIDGVLSRKGDDTTIYVWDK